MDSYLKGLKKAMDQTVFKDVVFTDRVRAAVKAKLDLKRDPEVDILQILQTKKTGYELLKGLISRGVQTFVNDEGMLYTFLHRLEQDEFIRSEWEGEEKFYIISEKGLKRVAKTEEKAASLVLLNEMGEGGRT